MATPKKKSAPKLKITKKKLEKFFDDLGNGLVKKPGKQISATKSLPFNVTLKIGELLYKGTGKTALDALTNLSSQVKKPPTYKCILTMTHGKQKAEVAMLNVMLMRRILFSALIRTYWANRLTTLLK